MDVALIVGGRLRMTDIAFVECGGLLEAVHATQRRCWAAIQLHNTTHQKEKSRCLTKL